MKSLNQTFSDKEILFFTKTMHTMLAAGITTLEALKLCEDQSTNKPLKKFLNQSNLRLIANFKYYFLISSK